MPPSVASETLGCRQCGQPVCRSADACPACGCKAPFSCAVCGRAVSALSLGEAPSSRHPYGSYSQAGEPLCFAHRLTACHACKKLYPQGEMKRRAVGQRADTVMREGKPPRIETVYGAFCPGCDTAAAQRSAGRASGSPAWLIAACILLVLACITVGLILLVTSAG